MRNEQREEGAQGRAHEPLEDGLREGPPAGAGNRGSVGHPEQSIAGGHPSDALVHADHARTRAARATAATSGGVASPTGTSGCPGAPAGAGTSGSTGATGSSAGQGKNRLSISNTQTNENFPNSAKRSKNCATSSSNNSSSSSSNSSSSNNSCNSSSSNTRSNSSNVTTPSYSTPTCPPSRQSPRRLRRRRVPRRPRPASRPHRRRPVRARAATVPRRMPRPKRQPPSLRRWPVSAGWVSWARSVVSTRRRPLPRCRPSSSSCSEVGFRSRNCTNQLGINSFFLFCAQVFSRIFPPGISTICKLT